ncbi:small ribosomal subunit protein bS16m-like [Dysidea avara]|uniref:small ribosomal subunit protein bS16m-like n=1 Tax=Dysidea avara TaxID=196820 RepID=UPI003322AE24
MGTSRRLRFRQRAVMVKQAATVLRIRLARWGCTNRPFYHIVVADARAPRNGRHFEQVGAFDPIPNQYGEKLVSLNHDRIKHWLLSGATPSRSAAELLGLAGLLPVHPHSYLVTQERRKLFAAKQSEAEQTSTEGDSNSS